MEAKEFIDLICPEHDRTSCSDDNISNGFYLEEDGDINKKYYQRCKRCVYLQIENGTLELTEKNIKMIPEKLRNNF